MTIELGPEQSIRRKTVSTLFFLSGMTGLSYEVIWFKQFSHVWGSSTLAMASVVGSFLFGLGLGAHFCGRLADRTARPVLWYGVFELCVGVLALLIPVETDVLWRFSVEHYAALRETPAMYGLVRFATTLLVIGPACALMGGTLPLLVRHFTAESELGVAAGWLYGINTVGAAVGCYLVGFHLLPEFGLFWTNVVTASANVIVGLAAMGVSFRMTTAQDKITGATPTALSHSAERPANLAQSWRPGSLTAACLIAALSGCAALVLQTVWNRQLATVLGSSTYAFTAVVFVVLLGIGMGSLIFRTVFVRHMNDGAIPVAILATLVLSTIGGELLLPLVAKCVGSVVLLRGDFTVNALICIAGSATVQLLPALAMGVLFPLLVHLTGQSTATAGRAVGNVYAWNTVGALAGAAATSVWILPTWGTRVAVGLALLMYVVSGIALAAVARPNRNAYVALTLSTAALGWFILTPSDPLRTNMGMFLYGYRPDELAEAKVLFFKEGAACNVLVSQEQDASLLRVNGKVDGNNRGDMAMQLGHAYLPRFLNPEARSVLVIGFGTGTTSGASLLFSGTEVTCCEIEPEVIKTSLARHLYQAGGDKNTRLSVLAAVDVDWFRKQFELLGCGPKHAAALHETALLLMESGFPATANDLVAFGLTQAPDDSQLLADGLILANSPNRELLERLLAQPGPSAAAEATRVGVAYWKRNQYALAADVFDRLCTKFPDSATSWINLAVMYDGIGKRQEAESAFRRAFELDPANEMCLRVMKLKAFDAGK